ncbi:hypothetical protein PTM93_06660 [Clostridium perfringens]|uniref:Uncharacterized protein n=3 Tax=Clostridium perfringens TaxID=1502 RepID=A0AAN5ZMJ8_CLOPF|nr:hypothetical protein [Clostridium perfringens]ABG83454.1 conserved hypothetical protein [Clostridium perfringens ATCC 13124]AMN32701.1 hypothetical protein JFP55_07205 [Clostridium perfringens]AQW26655.1 hypothetical protein BXT94_07715 [Clostridium perfringens]EDT22194.1 conserved hypothetical protein [Clostridium perfringens B str. ATCC 3626]EGT0694061.1 hypothetical protein [Clostridium perfringens]
MYFQELYDSSNMSILIAFIFYLIRIYPSYVMAKKANLKHSWMMFFPVLGEFQMLHLAGLSYLYFIIYLIPVARVILFVIVFYRILRNFGFGLFMTILGIIFSFIAFLTFWYIVLTDREFIGDIPREYQEF